MRGGPVTGAPSMMRINFFPNSSRARTLKRVSGRPGSCASYGDIAGVIGVPRGAQAVGNALRRNPVLLMTPCHRVLPASALEAAKRAKRLGGAPYETVGGFSGAMTGPLTDLKRHMLMWEAERFGSAEPALF